MFLEHLLDRVGVLLLPLHAPAHQRLERSGLDRLLLLRGQALPHVQVDAEFADRVVLVHAGRVVVLEHAVQAQAQIFDAADPFGAIDDAALRRGHDLAAGHVHHRLAHLRVHIGVQAGLPAFHAFEIGHALQRLLEPAQRLRAGRQYRKRHDAELQGVLVEVGPHLQSAALEHPAQIVGVIHAERSARGATEQRCRLVLADPVVGDGVEAIDHLLVCGVEHFERWHDLTGRHRLDLDLTAGELVHALGEEPEVVLEREACRPGRLHLERSGTCGCGLLGNRAGRERGGDRCTQGAQ